MLTRAFCVFFIMISTAYAGDLTGTLQGIGTPSPQGGAKTPPTAWEIATPLLRATDANSVVSSVGYRVVLFPEKPPKGKAKPGKVTFDKKGAKPSVVVIAPKSSVQFLSKDPITLRISGEKPKELTVSKKAAVSFAEGGIYSFTATKKPSINGLILVGLGARIAAVGSDGSFVFPKLTPGTWNIFLVSSKDVLEKGSVMVPIKGDPKPLTIEASQ